MPYANTKKKTKDKYPWVGQVRIQGRKSAKLFTNRRLAAKWEQEEKARLLCEPLVPISSVTIEDWARKYMEYAKRQFVPHTYWEKDFAFRLLFQSVSPSLVVHDFRPIMALQFLQQLEEGRSGNTANKMRKNLRAAWEWGIEYLEMPENPFSRVKRFAEGRRERRVPTLDEFWQVFNVIEDQQDRLMLLLYLHTGARRDELFRMEWKDVDLSGLRVRLYWRKNTAGQWESAWLPVKEEVADILKEQRAKTGLLRFVFLNYWESKDPQQWKPFEKRNHWLPRLCKRAKVRPFGLHGVRHLTASILAASGLPLVDIQQVLRHKSIATTQRYIHSLKKENRGVLEALPDLDSGLKSPTKARQVNADFKP